MIRTCALLLLLVSTPAVASPAVSSPEFSWWRDYAEHARQVPIGGGRTLHLLCEGRGSPTILLESGTGDGMTVWRKVQPVLAQHYRVCAYDRAGLGLSPPDSHRRDLDRIVFELEKLTARARLRPPYVLVSHSFGGMILRFYARHHRKDVAGMVLVDPPIENQLPRIEKIMPGAGRMAAGQISHSRACASAEELVGDCSADVPDGAPAAIVARLRAVARTHYLTQAAEMEESINGRNDSEMKRVGNRLGDLPLIVLTSEQFRTNEEMPQEARLAAQNLWMTFHDEIAAHSTRGANRVVPGTGHYIQLEKPDSVVAAVENVAAHLRR